MYKEYLIIWSGDTGEHYLFLENEEELLGAIKGCKELKCEIVFAAKIAVVKEFVG